ncbi:30S ribosomal protein S12 methylthiotransferase RimO [Roseisolibacter sp. H3M3-2]|uniref:30S ribosomal protein S12 methylthiotransferase RimO n=1 Tax=Roseisolibacter sp. H3M3-2 TaxID=3031323 RepID=UPI0023D9896F|nr:30S ribosomal protein S12 methylthiotransferase RimO [Roseisolibacter sp. H3M3-2]MDF1503098.1 30S ribosomal protein S12 methylthiotransferase RimO [Roseisolibacter sp. H3M3-2]
MKVALLTLGCDKNTVDSERYLAQLVAHGATPTDDASEAEVILVNTCGFIDAAKQESIDALVQAGQLKIDGACQAVVAVGCMVQRHKQELLDALPEVDLFLGASEVDRLVPELAARGVIAPDPIAEHPGVRLYGGDLPHVRYLKVSEGCDHGCAFCAIPLMRGKHRSFSVEDVVREAQLLELQGAREVNLVAQDLAHYGRDRRDGVRLPELLEALLRETSIPWLRNLYLYSTGITPRLLEVIAGSPRIVPYLDMPVQHASDAVLTRMRRPERQKTIREKLVRFRDAVPGVAIRTTCIVGFPGETEDDFRQLLDFLGEVRFDRVGAFTYSPQEGTRAHDMVDDVPEVVKRERLERLTELQREITAERYEERIGATTTVLVDRPASDEGPAMARAPWQADDVDGVTWVDADAAPGSFVEVEIDEVVDDYDFAATARRVLDAAPAAPRRIRALPMLAGGSTAGSFGR